MKLRVVSKTSKWQHRFFSSEGKKVLIKTVAQAKTYAMSVFRIPSGLFDNIQRAVARFWWGSKEDRRGIHWTRWKKLSFAKSIEGLGFRYLTSFNQALVAKQG